jgi:hypothetical protein
MGIVEPSNFTLFICNTLHAYRQSEARTSKISVCHGVGGMFAASGTIIMSNQPP